MGKKERKGMAVGRQRSGQWMARKTKDKRTGHRNIDHL
jgi:hypothetical protein